MFTFSMSWLWLFTALILFLIEASTVGLATIWFAGGALISALSALLNAPIPFQCFLFVSVSLILLVFTRPLAAKALNKKIDPSGAETLIGKKAAVLTAIDNMKGTGQVRIGDLEWSVRNEKDDQIIASGSIVEIVRIEGVKLIVRKYSE